VSNILEKDFYSIFYSFFDDVLRLRPNIAFQQSMAEIPLKDFIAVFWRTWIVLLAPFLLSPLLFLGTDPQVGEALKCAYTILLMAVYWMTEALPLPITSMMPMVVLPLLGIMSTGEVAINYLNSTNYMFLGGLIMAIAVEHCGLHNRVALRIIMMVGTSQARLMLGFMCTTMFLSMWISNTATTAMMLPIVDAVAEAINQKASEMNMAPIATLDPIVESGHSPDEEDDFNDNPFNQLTARSISELNQLTVNSINSLHPGNDPDSMVAFLPNVRRNTMERIPEGDPREKFKRRNTSDRLQTRFTTIPVETKEDTKIEITIEKPFSNKEEVERNFLLMSIAYAANIGGTGVVTGSPPNLVVPESLNKNFGPSTGLTFASWMAFAIPVMLLNLGLAWLWLQKLQSWYPGGGEKRSKDQEDRAMRVIKERYGKLGSMSMHEIQVFVLFLILILLWFFKTPLFMPGWGDIFKVSTVRGTTVVVGSATPAILMSVLLFVLPQDYNFWPFASLSRNIQNSPSLITWRLIETKMCWGVIFLLGGGFALADASQKSGLSTLLVTQLNKLNLNSMPFWLINFIVCLMTVSITNIASNTATANVLVPILAEMAVTMCINPIYLTLPAGIVCSYAFALPVATAPNAIVFGHSTMKTSDMMKAGLVMNFVCVFTIALSINTYAVPLFGLNEFPDWAAIKLENASMCAHVDPFGSDSVIIPALT